MVKIEVIKQSQAENEFERKMRLERVMLPSIRSIFSQMVSEYVAQLGATGSTPQAVEFRDEWVGILRRQYRRVGREFLPNQRKSKFYTIILEIKQTLSPEGNLGLLDGYSKWSRAFGEQQSIFITQTNQKEYTQAFQRAVAQDQEQQDEGGIPLGPAALAALAGIELRRLFRARETTIANVQTQAPAEEAKRREAVAIGAEEGKTEDEFNKTWQTVGDSSVRPSHVAANGQERPQNSAFTVEGENLRYPGDATLGASIGNLAGCRCAALYE